LHQRGQSLAHARDEVDREIDPPLLARFVHAGPNGIFYGRFHGNSRGRKFAMKITIPAEATGDA
jgi:hypothetical protein